MQLKLERLKLKRETDCSEGTEVNQAEVARAVFKRANYPDFPQFIDEKNDLDNYLLQFER